MVCWPLIVFSGKKHAWAVVARLVIAAACGVGCWCSLELARADHLFRRDTEPAIRRAMDIEPDAWQYPMRLAQFDGNPRAAMLARSLRLNPYNAQADIELGLEYEAQGDYARAERQLLAGYDVDHTYLPRWALANYYFRRGNMPVFWQWARSAAAMPSEDIRALFELGWRASPDAKSLTAALLNEKPEMLRQYLGFLLGKNQPQEAARIAPHLLAAGDRESDRLFLLGVVNALAEKGDAASAMILWHSLGDRHWVIADGAVPNNGAFARAPEPVVFDWNLPEYDGLHSWPGPAGLETEFNGNEPEQCIIAEQTVVLAPGRYAVEYGYRTSEIAKDTGIQWQVVDPAGGAILAESEDLASDDPVHGKIEFAVAPGSPLLRLRLVYRRPLGTSRVTGSLDVAQIQIQPLAGNDLSKMRQ